MKWLFLIELFFMVVLPVSSPVLADQQCYGCGRTIIGDPGAWWSGKPFCSIVCKDRLYKNYKRGHQTRRALCNAEVTLPGVVQHQGTKTVIVVGNTRDRYCDECRG